MKYHSIATTAFEFLWLQSLLCELHQPLKLLANLWCDNISATYLSANPVFHSRSKHLEIDFHFVCDLVFKKTLLVRHLSTLDQIADVLTKPLPLDKFLYFKNKLRVLPTLSLREDVIE